MFHRLVVIEACRVQQCVLMDVQRAVPAVWTDQQAQPPVPLFRRKELLLVPWLDPFLLRKNPDLKEVKLLLLLMSVTRKRSG